MGAMGARKGSNGSAHPGLTPSQKGNGPTPLGHTYGPDYLKHSLAQLKALRPSEAMRLVQLRGYRVQKVLDLQKRSVATEVDSPAKSAEKKLALWPAPPTGRGTGAGRDSFRHRPAGDVGWGVTSLRDANQTDGCRMLKTHVRGFDKKRSQQFVYQQDGFSAALDKKLGLQYADRLSIRHMREEVFSVMRHINKQGRYSQHIAAKKLASTRQS